MRLMGRPPSDNLLGEITMEASLANGCGINKMATVAVYTSSLTAFLDRTPPDRLYAEFRSFHPLHQYKRPG